MWTFVPPALLKAPRHTSVRRMSRLRVYSGPPGQDPAELFDVFPPPPASSDGFVEGPADILTAAPLATRKRADVHRDGDWHRSVHVWLADHSNKQLLMQKRSMHKDTNPGRWDVSAAGHISHGEGSLETAKKEVEEELGIQADALRLEFLFTAVAQFAAKNVHCNEFQDVYIAELEGDEDFDRLGSGEVSEVAFVKAADLQRRLDDGDDALVSRPEPYRKRFFSILSDRFGGL